MTTTDGPVPDTADQAPPPARRRVALWAALTVGVVLALFVGVLATRSPASDRRVSSRLIGKEAPATAGTTLDGQQFDAAEAGGKWVLVNFFATWCVPCRQEHPQIKAFEQEHAAAGDAEVVSVVFGDEPGTVKKFFDQFGGTWPVLLDTDGQIALDYGVTGVPESYLIGPDGKVYAKIAQGVTKDGLDAILAEVSGASTTGGGS